MHTKYIFNKITQRIRESVLILKDIILLVLKQHTLITIKYIKSLTGKEKLIAIIEKN